MEYYHTFSFVLLVAFCDAHNLQGQNFGFPNGGFNAYPYNSGPVHSSQSSQVEVGNGGTGIADGKATAINYGGGPASASQSSIAHGGANSVVVASGSSSATSGGDPRQYRSARFLPFPSNPVFASQSSGVDVGHFGTGIANGVATATNLGGGPATSVQNSFGRGGAGSLVVASGQSTATSGVGFPRAFRNARFLPFPSNPVFASQSSGVDVGHLGTGIASGAATATNLGGGPATSVQNSFGRGGAGSLVVASGQSTATSGGGFPRVFRNARFIPFPSGPVVASQSSGVDVGHFGTGIASGAATATNLGGGPATSVQNSFGRGGAGSLVVASGQSTATSGGGFPRVFRRSPADPNLAVLVPVNVAGAIQQALTTALNDPKSVVVSQSASATQHDD